MSEEEKKKVFEEFNSKKKEVSELRKKLNELDSHKEKWFKEKEKVQNEITKLISNVKELKKERDSLTQKVKSSKKERQELNKKINEQISKVKELGKDVPTINKYENPSRIKEEIKKLEYSIETQAISFEKERKIMKEIKEKKKKLKEIEKRFSEQGDYLKTSKEIDELKKNANNFHKEITKNANTSQEKHEEILKISKQIDELKKEEEEHHKKFIDYKKQFTEANKILKNMLNELSRLNEKISGQKIENAKNKRKKDEIVLKNKEEAVEEKIKKGKKLTTEDLLIFQKTNLK